MRYLRLSLGAAWLFLALASCDSGGPRKMKIWGAATFEGQPIETGSITLLPGPDSTEGTAVGAEIKEGRYEIAAKDGPLAGLTYKVEIKAQRKTGKTVPNPFNPSGPRLDEFEQFIP